MNIFVWKLSRKKKFFSLTFFTFEVPFNGFVPPLPEIRCPIFLEIQNPWGKVMERSGLTFEHFCLEVVLNHRAKYFFFFLLILPWSPLLWHWCYYPHRSRDALSPVCGIFPWAIPRDSFSPWPSDFQHLLSHWNCCNFLVSLQTIIGYILWFSHLVWPRLWNKHLCKYYKPGEAGSVFQAPPLLTSLTHSPFMEIS